jgi:hypothetical protein
MQMRPDEWDKLFKLRDFGLDGEDRVLVRRFIKYTEYLEKTVRAVRQLVHKQEQQ